MARAKRTAPAQSLDKVAVIYARFSSHNQREESIEQQVAEATLWASQHGYQIARVYEDHAISGRSDKRPDFQRMLRDAERGQFGVVIAYKSNRIARNMLHALQYEAKLEAFGVKTFYVKEEFGDTAAGRFALRTMMNVNQFYSENLAEDVKRGMMQNAQECKVNGMVAYGYKRGADGRYEVNETEAEVVRYIYSSTLAGKTFAEMARELNERGIKTRRGNEWKKGSFYALCHNENYIGVYSYNGVVVEGGVPAIIDRKEWQAVQEYLAWKEKALAHKTSADYLLTGKLICGECGNYMIGVSGNGKGGKYFYYTCSTRHAKGGCSKSNARKEHVERSVVELVQDVVLNDDSIAWIAKHAHKAFRDATTDTEIERLTAELKEVEAGIGNILKAVEAGMYSQSLNERMQTLEVEKETLQKALALAEVARVTPPEPDRIIFFLEQLRDGNAADPEYQKLIIDTFVRSVTLWDDHIEVDCYYTGEDRAKGALKHKGTRAARVRKDPKGVHHFLPIRTRHGDEAALSLTQTCVVVLAPFVRR